LVSTLGPDRGIAQIAIDGLTVATVDLYSPTLQTGQTVWSTSGLSAGTHTVKVTVLVPTILLLSARVLTSTRSS
jgi:hypothetical protein